MEPRPPGDGTTPSIHCRRQRPPAVLLPLLSAPALARWFDRAEGRPFPLASIERFAFYERAKKAYCVVQTGERRFYGCFIFKKGVIPPKKG